jgi:hypothetical protein
LALKHRAKFKLPLRGKLKPHCFFIITFTFLSHRVAALSRCSGYNQQASVLNAAL